jgi:plastocyanin
VGLGNVTNESKATMFASPTFTGTVSGVTATHVGLGNVTNESKATMFTNPTFTGTVTGISVTATDVGLGNVTNESKATMFSSPTFTGTVSGVTATHVGLGNVTNESKATMFASPTFTGTVSGISASMVSSLKYAKTELVVTNVANAGYRINYPDYSSSNNPIVYATAGETVAFNLNGISGNHPFLIQVNTAGTWANYDLGLVHVGNVPSVGTVNTGTNAQGKSVGILYWSLPPDIAPGDYRYICSIHFNMTGTIRVKGADQNITSIRSTTPTNVDFGTSWGNVNTTYYKWDIPAAGTYLVWGTFRARTWGTSGFAKIRLYNSTTSTVVSDSDTMLLENQNSLSLNVMCTANWRFVASQATTLYLQGFATAGTGCGIQSDSNGYNECGYIRIT